MQKKYLKSLLLVVLLFCSITTHAQETTFDKGKKYVIGGIKVTGLKSYNEQTVVTYTQLREGQEILIPGEEISAVIKKLWGLELFSDINFYIARVEGNTVFLELDIQELPTLSDVEVRGLKESKAATIIKESKLKKGKKVTESFLADTKNFIQNKYKKLGYYSTKVDMTTVADTTNNAKNSMKIIVNVDRGKKVKIKNINFTGNEKFSDKKLRRAMSNTKEKFLFRVFKASKLIPEDYKADLASIIEKYKESGYRDARITKDTITWNEDNTLNVDIALEEGKKYYFGDITFLGNAAYTDRDLNRLLGINKGDTYNGVLLEKRIADETDPDAADLTNLYQNNGYLFSNINPVEVSAKNDTIDFEIRIIEGKPAYFNNISVVGNEKTNDHVIYREIRTKPGELYSKDKIIRTIRELGQLGFFDAEQIKPEIKNPDPNSGTVDVEYSLAERGGSQIELQGGYGGGGFIGTLGLSFNNFSIRNLFKGDAYKPLPTGDGQKLALRAQASRFFQTFSFSFTEPWLGGKKPVQFTTSLSHTVQFLFNPQTNNADKDRRFLITGLSVGLAKRLAEPDDYFVLSQALSFQHYNLKNYNTGLFTFGNGFSNNFSYTVALSRNSSGPNPIYPMSGSEFSISAKITPPYSLFNNVDYGELGNQNDYQLRDANGNFLNANANQPGQPANLGPTLEPGEVSITDQAKVDQEKFKWLEFYKVKFKGAWYQSISGKLVLKTEANFGFLGAYDNDRGIIPFERFFVGGDGLGNYSLDGREAIALRGYPNQALSDVDGGTIYNKFSLELRYPITLKQTASIYVLSFLEAGGSFNSFKEYSPFDLNRSAGAGLRIFMPAFGLLGIDFGYGFDPIPGTTQRNGWETHFIIGQQF
ncbi:Outer membrane protein assembly factor BamA [Kordia antarctica]|uniref:Outer membrane protein assembly factor BamA n=1 Tax=Kordia antarctica TaxID=1218801 RepID=A0A7L4ZNY5_9FLAO|nr:outer membrane protein assembly factor BamA [Kordia antarctica]QHI38211.1 Outer membrane protein assembly factor BamA [Kordia antarctica]